MKTIILFIISIFLSILSFGQDDSTSFKFYEKYERGVQLLQSALYNSNENTKTIYNDSLKIQQLAGLCEVWGYLKYYHPEIQKGHIDWDTTLILYFPKVLKAKNNEEYNKIINSLILLPGKVTKLKKPYEYLPKDTTINNLDFTWIKNNSLFTNENSNLLIEIIENYKPCENVYIAKELNRYYYDDNNFSKYYYKNEYCPDSAHALLALCRYWNTINYFFAYKKLTDENWNDVLIEFIPKVIRSAGSIEFYSTFVELITKINDCHGDFYNYNFNKLMGSIWLPLIVKYVEGKTIITSISDSLSKATKINKGDVILKIDGIDINERRKDLKKYCSCSHKNSVDRIINWRLLNTPKDSINFMVVDSNNAIKSATINVKHKFTYFPDYAKWKTISDSIGYFKYSFDITRENVKKAFKDFEKTKYLIVDLRYTTGTLDYLVRRLPYKKNKKKNFCKYYIPDYKYPGTFTQKPILQKIYISPEWSNYHLRLNIFHKMYKGTVIFLINENNQSSNEAQLMRLKAAFNVKYIGCNTSGTDGATSSILIQNNFLAYFTGDALFWPDGSQQQRIGIKPDIYITPTIKGIQQGKDEVLDRAIEYIKKGN